MTAKGDLDIPVMNLGKFMLERMQRFGDEEALVDSLTDAVYTYKEAAERVCRLATGLQRIGVKEGDVVTMVTPNSIDYSLTFVAMAMIGAVYQPLSPLSTKDDISRAVKECSSKFIIILESLLEKVTEAADQVNAKVIVFGSKEGCISFQSLLEGSGPPTMPTNVDYKTTPAALFQTSGTTGRQKFVMHGHYSLIANIIQLYAVNPFPVGETMIAFLPMFHVYCLICVTLASLAYGARVVVMATFSAEPFLQLIQKHKVTSLHVIPPVMAFLAKSPVVGQYDLTSVRRVFCGAAPLSFDVEETVKRVLKLSVITQGYAMTETLVTSLSSESGYRPGSNGHPLPMTYIRIVGFDTELPVATAVQGEITVRGPQAALGYLNLPDETSHVFRKDGWIHTGDIGYIDKDCYLFTTGRLKELIKYHGLQVSPTELEDILLMHSGIADAAVVGVPDEEAGELPKAFVVRKTGAATSEGEIKSYVAERVAPHMFLRGGVQFIDKIPKSPAGKILRNKLKEFI